MPGHRMTGMPEWLLDLEMESGEPIEVGKKAGREKKGRKWNMYSE